MLVLQLMGTELGGGAGTDPLQQELCVHIPSRSGLARLELGQVCARDAQASSRSRGAFQPGLCGRSS